MSGEFDLPTVQVYGARDVSVFADHNDVYLTAWVDGREQRLVWCFDDVEADTLMELSGVFLALTQERLRRQARRERDTERMHASYQRQASDGEQVF